MSSENSSYESAPLALDLEAETLINGPTTETMAQEENSNPAPNPNPNPNNSDEPVPDQKPNADPVPNPNPNPDNNPDPPKRRGRKKKEVPVEAPPNYQFKFQEEEKLAGQEGPEQAETELYKYKVNHLVWGKVKHHPWWPGQIYDPSLASEAALKIKKEGHFLVAYFGDKTFAWNEASALKPYTMTFPKMEKQSSVEPFVRAVDSSLAEVSRRVEVSIVCHCSDRKHASEQFVDNAGIINGTHVPDVDNSIILESFKVDSLMEYVQRAAVYGRTENLNRLDIVMAAAYLKVFDKFRGFTPAPVYAYGEEFGNDPDKVPKVEQSGTSTKRGRPKKKDEQMKDDSKQESDTTPKKRGRPKKNKQNLANTDDLDYEPQSQSNEMPKRRGSSKKGKGDKMSIDEYGSSSESDNMSKKRGRPKKRKQINISNNEYDPLSESGGKPKKRGRPKKKQEVEISDDEFDPMSESDEIPKKRGRPKKKQEVEISDDEFDPMSESDELPKKRGRCKKKQEVEISDDEFDPLSESGEMPKKRRRPKKKQEVEISDDEFDSLSESDEMPKKRGRPKKKLAEISGKKIKPVSKARSPSSKLETPIISDTSTARKRGRPKKIQDVGIYDREIDLQSKARSTLPKTPPKSDTGSLKKRGRPRKEAVQGPSVPVEYPPSSEMLMQLCLTAEKPVENLRPTSTVLSFFTKYKNSLVPKSLEEKDLIEETGTATKSGRRVSKPKHIQDSYWTDVMVDTGSDKDEEPDSTTSQKKKRGPYNKRERSNGKSSEVNVVAPEFNTFVTTDVIAEVSDEFEPTSFVLYFNNPDAIPTVEELNEIFGSFGPLRPAETEIDKKLNRATVIFKRRVDAEGAFSSTGKYSKFGPALLSYELDYTPGPPKVIPSDGVVVCKSDALTTEGKNLVDNGEASSKDGAINVCPGKEGPTGKQEPAEVAIAADKRIEPSG